MKKIHIVGIITGLFLLSVMVSVFAHSQQSQEKNEVDYMDEIHEKILENIEDPELRKSLEEMHEGCETFHNEERTRLIGHMMGW